MKILFIAEFFPAGKDLKFSGGVEAYNYFLVNELSKRNNVTVICNNAVDKKEEFNFKILRVGTRNPVIESSFFSIPQRIEFLYRAIKFGIKEDFDVIQGNNFVTYPIAYLIGLVKKKPIIFWYPDVFIGKWRKLTGNLSGIIGEILERIYLKLPFVKFIALSSSTKEKLIRNGVRRDIPVIYGGVDVGYFNKFESKKQRNITIICIARMVKYKRIDLLINAAGILRDKGLDFKIEIIGSGPEKTNLFNMVKNLDLDGKIVFRSNLDREELAKRLKNSDIFCLPSQVEGFGLVVVEAAACKLPMVLSNISIFKEVTRGGEGAIFFESGSEVSLAQCLEKLIKSEKLRNSLGQKSFSLTKYYSWNEISNQFLVIYTKCIKRFKILMLIDAWFPHVGGGQIHVWELSKKLADLGCEVTVFTRNNGSWKEDYEGVKVIRNGFIKEFSNPLGRIEYLFRSLLYSIFSKYDILHAHAFSPGLIIPMVRLIRNKKFVFTVHGKGVKIAGFNFSANFLEELVFYRIPYDLEISVAGSTVQKSRLVADRYIVIPNGIEIKNFKGAVRKRTKVRKILFVGRLSFEKGVDLLIKAFRNLKIKNLTLTIVGHGPEEKKLRILARGSKIKFKGRLLDKYLIDEYRNADLLVLPSRTEGHPLTLFEAQAAKIPVLATDVGDNKKYIKNEVSGFLALPNEESINNSLLKIIKFNKLEEVVENAYQNLENFSWEKVAMKVFKEYEEILNEKS